MTEFIDIHCHILPGIDDGPDTVDTALRMLQLAKRDGIKEIIATPHIMEGVYINKRYDIQKSLVSLRERADILPIGIGAEIRIGRDTLQRLLDGDYPTLNDGKYALIEFPFYSLPPLEEIERIIKNFILNGIIPIVAHPEKNIMILNNLRILKRLTKRGVLFQATASSIINGSYRIQKTTLRMIKNGYIHVIASDAHDPVHRPPLLSEAYIRIKRVFSEKEAKRLFLENPWRIIKGEEVIPL
jgi:protein-tyrosine phosphatase